MNCAQCLHTHLAHEFKDSQSGDNDKRSYKIYGVDKERGSLMYVGRCLVPGCVCLQYVDKIEKIDEDLL